MNNIRDITWIYDSENQTCHIQIGNQPERELTTKDETNKGGIWYQVGEEKRHWISFNPDKFDNRNIEIFYKRIEKDKVGEYKSYYRKLVKGLEKGDGVLVFSFSEFDEWIFEDGKWKSKHGKEVNKVKQPWKEFNNE